MLTQSFHWYQKCIEISFVVKATKNKKEVTEKNKEHIHC